MKLSLVVLMLLSLGSAQTFGFEVRDSMYLEADNFMSFGDSGSGSGVIPPPTCRIGAQGEIIVESLDPRIGCVMRDDSYDELVPQDGRAVFQGPAPVSSTIGVEIYTTLNGPKDCTGYIGNYGTIFCESVLSDNNKSDDGAGSGSGSGSGAGNGPSCWVDSVSMIHVMGLDSSVGCVMRTDIYTGLVPLEDGTANFPQRTLFAGTAIELYSNYDSNDSCSGYQAQYGSIFCTGNSNTRPLPPPPPPGFLEYNISAPVCTVKDGIISVSKLNSIVGCVIRTDTWNGAVPEADGSVVFEGATSSKNVGVEIYVNYDGPGAQNCSRFIPNFGTVFCENLNTEPDLNQTEPLPPAGDFPVCSIIQGKITITNVDPRARCIMRTDNYQEIVPVDGSAVFSVPASPKVSIELYTILNGPSDCGGFLSEYGTVACVVIPTEPKAEGELAVAGSGSGSGSGNGSGSSLAPRCDIAEQLMVVSGLDSSVGCVLRTDSYRAAIPSQGVAAFSAPVESSGVGVELYANYFGEGDCGGFLSFFGTVECVGNNSTLPLNPPPVPGVLKYPNLPRPSCKETNNGVEVEGLDSVIQCVIRTDTWAAKQPVNGAVSFADVVTRRVGIEIYEAYDNEQDCTGFISNFGTIWCDEMTPQPEAQTSEDMDQSNSSSSAAGVIVGSLVGGVALVSLIVGGVFYHNRRRNHATFGRFDDSRRNVIA